MAAVIGAHGLKGEVKVKTFTDTADSLKRYERLHARDGRVFTVQRLTPTKAGEANVVFAEVLDRTMAEGL